MRTSWTSEDLAEELLSRRDELLINLPRRIQSARRLSHDLRDFVVDDAATFVALEYSEPITSAEEAERVFWRAAELRVARSLDRRRRHDTVRGQFERAGEEALETVPANGGLDPAERAVALTEHAMATEFAATLDPEERTVLRRKWLIDPEAELPRGHTGSEPLGWRALADQLDMPPRRVRAAERSIESKLDRFAALVAAGRLCQQRAVDLDAVVAGLADPAQSNLAHAHLEHCATCKADFVVKRRAVRSAEFARKVAVLVPPVPLEESRQPGRLREFLADWISRLTGHSEAVSGAAQASASGVGRGAGGVLTVKLLAVLASGAATIGAATGVLDERQPEPNQPKAVRASEPTATPAPSAIPDATPSAERSDAHRKRAAARRARVAKRKARRREAVAHESTPVSPAPSGSQPNGASEFTPDSSNLPAPAPAAAPAASGASEFP